MRLAFIIWVGVVALVAVVSCFWTPYDVAQLDISVRLQPPLSGGHLLGTDHFGRDILSMMMVGARVSLMVAFVAVGIGFFIGVPLGLMASRSAAHTPSRTADHVIMRGSDLAFAFPALVTAILITATLGAGIFNSILAIGIFNIPVFVRVTRGAALSLWFLDFIRAARVAGKSNARIAVEHILPNIAHLLIVQATIQFSLGILAEAGLSYVGLGTQPPVPSWGRMLAESQTMIAFAPHLGLIPGGAIIMLVLGVNILGDGLRDWLDPKRVQERRMQERLARKRRFGDRS